MSKSVSLGDHVVTPRMGFTHHGIYIGDQRVMHYAGFIDGFAVKGPVAITSLERFDNGFGFWVQDHDRKFDRAESVERAYSRLGEDDYHILFNNCEHFVSWCISGVHSSAQIKKLTFNAAAISFATLEGIGNLASKVAAGWRAVQEARHLARAQS
ncbi:lecithin retinol acyltransferase family protein [Aquirhabdus sp.]|uniref:lecithin retinol acyltransferase family protein n=1 Tax=Aquirhabdus sp. TaxID=2824160 RepID=UPI00396CD876